MLSLLLLSTGPADCFSVSPQFFPPFPILFSFAPPLTYHHHPHFVYSLVRPVPLFVLLQGRVAQDAGMRKLKPQELSCNFRLLLLFATTSSTGTVGGEEENCYFRPVRAFLVHEMMKEVEGRLVGRIPEFANYIHRGAPLEVD